MKSIIKNILYGAVCLYCMSLAVMTPYYNWLYAKEHGFIRWIFLGEIAPTLKAVAWPYFVFVDSKSAVVSPDERHYDNSKKSCDEAIKIIIKAGDVTHLTSDDKAKVTGLLELSIAESNQVQPQYLKKVHPEFLDMYEKNYKYAMSLMVQGLKTDNTLMVLTGSYGYNEFASWMQSHKTELSF